jgi:hypothetical protein
LYWCLICTSGHRRNGARTTTPFFGTIRSETSTRAYKYHSRCVHRLWRARVRSVGRSHLLLSANASTVIDQASAATTASFATRTVTYSWKYLLNASQPVCKGLATVGTWRRPSCHRWRKLTRTAGSNPSTLLEEAMRKQTNYNSR